jgi:chemotaxis protein MotB
MTMTSKRSYSTFAKFSFVALSAAFLAVGSVGCVSQGKYDQAVSQTEITRAQLKRTEAALSAKGVQLEQSNIELTQTRADIDKLKKEIAQLEELDKTKTGDVVTSRSRIGELQKRLGELEAAQRAAEARAAVYKNLTLRLKKQIDDGDLAIVIRDGRMVLQLPNDVLFDTGRTELKTAGKNALKAVADVMKFMAHRQFQISGHTDNVPIHNGQFASNWELSSGRALRVVHFLIGEGVDAQVLSAAGYSEVDPVSSNETPEGRKQNRRTEITLQPNIDELVKIPNH